MTEQTLEQKKAELQRLKEEIKQAEQKYTWKGFYSRVCGRKNILKGIGDEVGLDDAQKIAKACIKMQEVVDEYQAEETSIDEKIKNKK